MRRKFAIIAAAVAVVVLGAPLAAPLVGQKIAEAKVDAALKRIRIQSTSVVNRGKVTADLWSMTVVVRDITVESPGGASRVSVGAMTVERPSVGDGQLTASRVVIEDAVVQASDQTTSIPRVEITNYSGPERGLASTPGVGATARTQADVIERVSVESAAVPLIVVSNATSRVRRTARNLRIGRVTSGVVDRATLASLAIEAPYVAEGEAPEPGETPDAASVAVRTGDITYEGLSLPTLWRFYAGDGAGDRDPLAKSLTVAGAQTDLTLRPAGRLVASLGKVRVEDVATRSLGFPLTVLDPIAARARLGRSPTPAEIRQQLLLVADALKAVSFGKVAVEGVKADANLGPAGRFSARLDLAEIGRYADAQLDSVKVSGLAYDGSDGRRLAVSTFDARRFDIRGLADHAERVGRNEVLLTTAPTAEEIVRIAPRLTSADLAGFDAATAEGSLKADTVKIAVDAPIDAVPQHVSFKLEGLDAAPPPGSRIAEALKVVELDGLKGQAAFALTLDPTEKTLKLDSLDYRFQDLGTVKAKGELAAVDPVLAVATGAAFVDKLTAIRLGTFKILLKDDGAVEVLLRRAAAKADVPPEEYRESFARKTQETIFRVLGPPAENSAESAAEFIREPRTAEITIIPRNVDQTLVELLQSLRLGPEGIAQTIDLAVLYRR